MARWEPDAEGRLIKAAITLFAEQGYEETTVEQIAAAAGLTKRTFFRYFADKREVLFDGAHQLQATWTDGIAAAPAGATALAAVRRGLDDVVALFDDRLAFARLRGDIVAANPELQERELIKLQTLTEAIRRTLVERGVPGDEAVLAAHAGVTVFHVGFGRWVAQDDPAAFGPVIDEVLAGLCAVTAAGAG